MGQKNFLELLELALIDQLAEAKANLAMAFYGATAWAGGPANGQVVQALGLKGA